MSSRYVSDEKRAAAVADFHASGDAYYIVAARHNVSRSALHSWVNPKPHKPRGPWEWPEKEVALTGGRWVTVLGVKRWVQEEPQESCELSAFARRIQDEEAAFTEQQGRAAHARFVSGDRDDETVLGEKVYQRRMKREKRVSGEAA